MSELDKEILIEDEIYEKLEEYRNIRGLTHSEAIGILLYLFFRYFKIACKHIL